MECRRLEIEIRRMVDDDFALVRPWFDDPENARWLKSVYRLGKYNRITHQLSLKQRSNYLCIGLAGNVPVGLVGLSHIDRLDRSAMVWYLIASNEMRGQGVATKLVNLILKEAFGPLTLHSVYASVVEANIASCRVLQKNNFRCIGVQRQCHSVGGSFHNRLIFDLLIGEQPA
jgi:RimJ/RimL family protein N-acetyltransferase